MLGTTSRLERVVVLIVCLWACTFDSYDCGDQTVCEYTEVYDEVVTVSVNELVHVTKNRWCLGIPPRCPDNVEEYRTVQKNTTVPKTRVIKKCCENSVQLYNNCVPKCTEKQCPNIQCSPDTDKCECKSGYTGHFCRERCGVGRWGPGCENSCHHKCSDCDHRTGCCMTAWAIRNVRNRTNTEALTFCADLTTVMPAGTETPTVIEMPARIRTGRTPTETMTTGTKMSPTGTETTTLIENLPDTTTAKAPSFTYIRYEYPYANHDYGWHDDLLKKFLWISAITVVVIAMVFVIMFVVFFNCSGASGVSNGAKNQPCSASASSSADPRIQETYVGTHKLGHVTLERNTKNPGSQITTNNDLPIHPEVFCPIFSSPHHAKYTTSTEISLYDSPQPLYEILG